MSIQSDPLPPSLERLAEIRERVLRDAKQWRWAELTAEEAVLLVTALEAEQSQRLAAEQALKQPARTGCDECLEARRDMQAKLAAAEADRLAAEAQVRDWAYRVGEWESITALLADREEATTYLKVEALDAQAVRMSDKHEYSGDPKHCHDCALRAFVNAELRTRVAEQERDHWKNCVKAADAQRLAAEQEILCGAIRNLQQAHLSEKGNADEAEAECLRLREARDELLAALRAVAHHADDECGFMVLVKAAIAKVQGYGEVP